jgi:superfamily II DNA or RNA helicase
MAPIEIRIDSRLRLQLPPGGLPRAVCDSLQEAFDYSNPRFYKTRGLGYSTHDVPLRVKTWRDDSAGTVSFPRGGLQRVRDVLRAAGLSWRVVDARVEGNVQLGVEYTSPLGEPAQHQIDCVEVMHRRENALLRIPTGGRKTSVGMMLAAKGDLATLVLVDTKALLEQWLDRVHVELPGLGSAQAVGLLGDGVRRVRPFTLGMIPTLASIFRKDGDEARQIRDYFGTVIVDEVQGAAADRTTLVVDALPARRRYGISADERRADGLEFLTHDLFGEPCYEIDRETLVSRGVIVDVEIRVVPTEFDAPWYGHSDATDDEVRAVDFDRLLKEMLVDDARTALAAEVLAAEAAAGHAALALAHYRDHCHALARALVARGATAGFLIGGDDYADEFARTRDRVRAGEAVVGVGTVGAIGKGLDFPSVEVGLALTPVNSRQKFNQMRGRFCRASAGKGAGRLYVMWDERVYPNQLRHLANWNPTVCVRTRDGRWVTPGAYEAERTSAQVALLL